MIMVGWRVMFHHLVFFTIITLCLFLEKKVWNKIWIDVGRINFISSVFAELMMLQSKFEHDKKRLQQLRAARKFRPY